MCDTYAATDEVDFPLALDPNIKPAAVGNQKTCGSNNNAGWEPLIITHTSSSMKSCMYGLVTHSFPPLFTVNGVKRLTEDIWNLKKSLAKLKPRTLHLLSKHPNILLSSCNFKLVFLFCSLCFWIKETD